MCAFAVLFTLLFGSCANPLKQHTHTEVDFNDVEAVQLTYKQNLYDVKLRFCASILDIEFQKSNTAYDGIAYEVTPQSCEVNYSGLVHSFKTASLPDDFLPNLLWHFFIETGNAFNTEGYDSKNECYYLTRIINNSFVRFEVYKNEGNVSYTMIIT